MAAGGQLLVAGNGGSAADAQHIAAELTGRFLLERRPFRALALHVNTSSLTAIGNDYGYEHVFAREVAAHARPGDVLLAISTSGNSANILRAIDAARECKAGVIGLTGETGGKMRAAVRYLFVRADRIDAADAGDAHHDRPHNLRAIRRKTRFCMTLNSQIREARVPDSNPGTSRSATVADIAVTLLTGGTDRPYTYGLTMELIAKGVTVEVIGSDSLEFPEFHTTPGLTFRNLQGSQRADVSLLRKMSRLLGYYAKLIRYAATAKPRIFHILWNGKFELFDRTALTIFFRLLGKRIVLTAHNVNAGKRDSTDSLVNRLSLRVQYRLTDHIFVHTEKGKLELGEEFGVQPSRVSVIPFGINNSVPKTSISQHDAKQRLGIQDDRKTILFFGRITPYKGLEYLVTAFRQISRRHDDYRLIVAGRPENDCQSLLGCNSATNPRRRARWASTAKSRTHPRG